MKEAFIWHSVRTPIGHYGALAGICGDDLGALLLSALLERA